MYIRDCVSLNAPPHFCVFVACGDSVTSCHAVASSVTYVSGDVRRCLGTLPACQAVCLHPSIVQPALAARLRVDHPA